MIAKLIFRNLVYKPYITILSLVLLCIGCGIISVIVLVENQIRNKFEATIKDIDMVIGAKGSPLQLVLSAVFHIDAPTGNIHPEEISEILKSPLIQQSIPLAYGDSYKGFRILGTDSLYIKKYAGTYKSGSVFRKNLDVVTGSSVAEKLGLDLGHRFSGNHGLSEHGESHDDHEYHVVGILNYTGTVLDNLIITNVETVRDIHHEEAPHSEVNHQKEDTDQDHDPGDKEEPGEHDNELTALLIKFKSPQAMLSLPRIINEETKMQAALPVLEINRLVKLMGVGTSGLKYLAGAIILVSGLSMFISLYIRMKDREFEIALLRSFGFSKTILFLVPVLECIVLSAAGFLLGILFSRLVLLVINRQSESEFHWSFNLGNILTNEWFLLLIVLFVGMMTAMIPAAKVFNLNLAKTLSDD